ncbi:amidase signature domain-containing protein [Xylariales sp. PMI_506]|nr:amidase signature domain-containing protein [Xylariales sp. PMI_506]
MSIVSLAAGNSLSKISIEDLHQIAAGLNIKISNAQDAEAYLLLLKSFEEVMQHVERSDDYIHPDLAPQAVLGSRDYQRPEPSQNPMNAWSHQCNLEAAKPTSELLKGRTLVVKDNVPVGGLPTTMGTHPELFGKDGVVPVSTIDATVVARALAAGAVIKGTSTCENFCASPLSWTSVTGPVDNPLLPGYTAGGSSSGSCALVAANELRKTSDKFFGDTVELAIGGDQAGSIRNPASYTGLYGLKPTFGLVPYTGAASMSPMIDHLGPIAKTLEDIALLLKVMSGYDGIDPRMTPESPLASQVEDYPALLADYRRTVLSTPTSSEEPRLKVGILTESFGIAGLAPEVADLVKKVAREAFEAAGAEVIDISVPMHTDAPIIWTASTRPSMSQWLCQGRTSGHLSYLSPHISLQWPPNQESYDLLTASNPGVVNINFSGELNRTHLSPSIEAKAHRKVFELRAAYDAALREVDILVTPCAPTIAMPHPRPQDSILERLKPAIGLTSNTCPFNITGHPALATPCGTLPSPEHPQVQLPVGMQIIGKRWGDAAVLQAAALFESGKALLAGK